MSFPSIGSVVAHLDTFKKALRDYNIPQEEFVKHLRGDAQGTLIGNVADTRHDWGGVHIGICWTKRHMSASFYWPVMGRAIPNFVKSCQMCQELGKAGDRSKAAHQPLPLIGTFWAKISIDLLGPFKRPASRGNKFFLTIINCMTRYPEAVPLARTDSNTIAKALSEVFACLGWPLEILMDCGTNFLSNVLERQGGIK